MADLMKLMMKFRFQGPSFSLLHHFTAFIESDSTRSRDCRRWSYAMKIFMALWIASISAWLISTNGMGLENTQMKFPWWFLSTPPIDAFISLGLMEASTFHFREEMGGGSHGACKSLLDWASLAWGAAHFCTSFGVYGKVSSHPLIHQLVLRRISVWSCGKELEVLLKHLEFLSFHMVHIITKKTEAHTFLKNLPCFGKAQCSNAALIVEGAAHGSAHKPSHQFHNWLEYVQCKNRWSLFSTALLQRTQFASDWEIMPMHASFPFELVFPRSACHVKISILWGE